MYIFSHKKNDFPNDFPSDACPLLGMSSKPIEVESIAGLYVGIALYHERRKLVWLHSEIDVNACRMSRAGAQERRKAEAGRLVHVLSWNM